MSRLLVIGCGGVASVAIRKCCQNSDVFTEIMIASRTKEKCDALKEKIESTTKTKIETAKVDADNAAEVAELIHIRILPSWMHVWKPVRIILILPIMKQRIQKIPHGVQSMKRDVKKKALLHISIIPGSGLMMRNLRKQD